MTSGKKEDFSRRFGDLLVKHGVSEKARPYYERHLERWGIALRGRPAGMAKKDFLEGYLKALVDTKGVAPFVVWQTADAVRLAHEVLLGEEWAREVDWEGLRAEYGRDRGEEPGEVVAETRKQALNAAVFYLTRVRGLRDVDLQRGTVTVRGGKGDKDRMAVLPRSLRDDLSAQIGMALPLGG